MKLGLGRRGLSFGGSGGPPKPVTDYFNGFELSGSTFSGGPTVVADNTGTLVTSPSNVLPLEGMRLSGSTWLPTTSLGAPIHTSTPLRTRKGTVSVYSEDFRGALIEPPRTNKVTCRKANPVDTTNITKSGDAAAVLSVIDAPDGLLANAVNRIGVATSLASICTTGKIYELDNTAGTAAAYATVVGATGNTNVHSFRCYMQWVSGGTAVNVRLGATVGQVECVQGTALVEKVNENLTPSATGNAIFIAASAGSKVRFILPQLEEGAFATSPIARASDGSDPLTALTRDAKNLTRPTAGTALAALNNWGIRLRFRPTAAGQTAVLWGSYTDANNSTRIDLAASTLTYTKRLSGSNHVAQASLTHAAATLYDVIIYQHSVSGMGIAFRSWNGSAWSAWSAWATLTDANGIANAAIAPTYQLGALNNANHVSANMPFCHMFGLKASLAAQTEIADMLAKGRI